MRQVVVHIGLEKAASTSFQASLVAARDRLGENQIVYPQIGGGGAKDQRDLRFALEGNSAAFARTSAALRGAADGGERLVLSGETLYYAEPESLLRLLAASGWGDVPVTAVAIVREPAGWLNSRYAFETVQFRHRVRFSRFLARRLRPDFALWPTLLTRWQEAEGITLVAVPLRAVGDPRGTIPRTIEAMGIDPSLVPEGSDLNESLDPRTVEAGRRLAFYRVGEVIGQPFHRRVRGAMLAAAEAEGFNGRFQALDARLTEAIDTSVAPALERFASAVWNASWCDVYDRGAREYGPVNEWGRGPSAAQDEAAIRRVVTAVRRGADLRGRLLRQLVPPLAGRFGTKG